VRAGGRHAALVSREPWPTERQGAFYCCASRSSLHARDPVHAESISKRRVLSEDDGLKRRSHHRPQGRVEGERKLLRQRGGWTRVLSAQARCETLRAGSSKNRMAATMLTVAHACGMIGRLVAWGVPGVRDGRPKHGDACFRRHVHCVACEPACPHQTAPPSTQRLCYPERE